MYDFIFWYFYSFFEWRQGYASSFLAATCVALAGIIHFFLLHALVRFFTGYTIGRFSESYGVNKFMWLPIVLGWFFVVYLLFYRTRTNKILDEYKERKISEPKSIVLVILLLVVPLVIAIWFTNKSVQE